MVPFYYFNGLFYMPYVTPIGESPTSGGGPPTEAHYVDESDLLSSVIKAYSTDSGAEDGPGEATVRLDARPLPDNKITIDTTMSDRTVARTEDDRNRIVHHALGHVSHNKMAATSAVVDGMPKYSKFDTWCTCCQKAKCTCCRTPTICGTSGQHTRMPYAHRFDR